METIATMKSPFAPTISSVDIQMLNVLTLATRPVAMIGPSTMTETTNKIATTKTTKTIKTTSMQPPLYDMLSTAKRRKPPTTRSFG
jgi:hypothetical protein